MAESKAILAINTGSSSLKFSVFQNKTCVLQGEVENINTKECIIWSKGLVDKCVKNKKISTHFQAIKEIKELCRKSGILEFQAICHRLVFGGDKYTKAVKLNKKVISDLKAYEHIAPLHIPKELHVIKSVDSVFPKCFQVGCFDTSFHKTIKEEAKTLPLLDSSIHKFGFHGLSYEYISSVIPREKKRLVVAHLGSGASLCAIKNKKSVDTTMGFTPLGGIMMGTRPGDIDPGVILYLLEKKHMNFDQLHYYLNSECGLKGVSKHSSDMKELLKKAKTSDLAKLAIEMFCYQVAKQIGAYFVTLGGIDALVFTGGIGYRSHEVRVKICKKLKALGIEIDTKKAASELQDISKKPKSPSIYVVETHEEQVMNNQTLALLGM